MKNIIITLLASLMMIGGASASSLKEIERSTTLLYEDNSPVCSMQMTYKGFLTAAHCIDETKSYSFKEIDKDGDEVLGEKIHYLKIEKIDKDNDVALLSTKDKIYLPAITVAFEDELKDVLVRGTPVLVIGFPASKFRDSSELVFTDGRFVDEVNGLGPLNKTKLYRTTAPIYYGNSGGGLYVEINGTYKLIGTTSLTNPELPFEESYYSTTKNIWKLFDE